MEADRRVTVGGPYFEDLERGQVFDAPAMTLTWGHAAIHQAIAGDRMLLPLDAPLSREVTGSEDALIHPNLVCDVAIGQSTVPTQRVLGNLFYRGLVLLRQVFRGDTLRTRTEVVALKQNRPRADGSASGLAVLRIQTQQPARRAGARLLSLPDDPAARPRRRYRPRRRLRRDLPASSIPERVRAAIPSWDYEAMRARVAEPGAAFEPGTVHVIEGRDTVTTAPELARLTLNLAMTHRDGGAGTHGRRLVYGGQTISIAARTPPGRCRRWRRSSPGAAASTPRPSSRGTSSAPRWPWSRRRGRSIRTRRSPTCAPPFTPTEEPANRPSRCSTGPSSASSPDWRSHARNPGRPPCDRGVGLRRRPARRHDPGPARRRRDPLRPDRRRAGPQPLAGHRRRRQPLLGRPQQGQALAPGGPSLRSRQGAA